jgi:hypothetical protein
LTSIYHPQIGGNFPRFLVDQPTIFMVAFANLWSKQVNTIIKKVMAPLEGGPEFAPNEEVGE